MRFDVRIFGLMVLAVLLALPRSVYACPS